MRFFWSHIRKSGYIQYDNGEPIIGGLLYADFPDPRDYDWRSGKLVQIGLVRQQDDGQWLAIIDATLRDKEETHYLPSHDEAKKWVMQEAAASLIAMATQVEQITL